MSGRRLAFPVVLAVDLALVLGFALAVGIAGAGLACASSTASHATGAAGPAATPAAAPAAASARLAAAAPAEADEYVQYELLAPESARFRILYDVTAVAPGATAFFNPIRKGSEASEETVFDRSTGNALPFEVVPGSRARAEGEKDADPEGLFIRVALPRPVPAGGGVRLRIDKTYKDPKSYFRRDDRIVFSRSLDIKRNAIVLPSGYELVGCSVPSQVLRDPDGRIRVSFVNPMPDAASVEVSGRALPGWRPGEGASAAPAAARPSPPPRRLETAPAALPPSDAERLSERARQDRTIVYFLRAPETHAFDLSHDYTESREGVARYVNVVRMGSRVSAPSAKNLDTGESLPTEIRRGSELAPEDREPDEPVSADAEVVLVRFPRIGKGQSMRLRISETYTDPARYRLEGDELVWDRALGRPRNAVVLPDGWFLTASAIPATVSETADGRIRLDFVNPRPDEISVLLRARRR